MIRGQQDIQVYNEDEESAVSVRELQEIIRDEETITDNNNTNNNSNDEENGSDDSDEDNSIPDLQDREVEDSSDDDSIDDSINNDDDTYIKSLMNEDRDTAHLRHSRRDRDEYIDSDNDSDKDSYGNRGNDFEESIIPKLICRIDNDDSSCDDDDDDDDEDISIECSVNKQAGSSNSGSCNSEIEAVKNSTTITGMMIEIKAKTHILRLRGGSGDGNTNGSRNPNNNEDEDEDLYFQASDEESLLAYQESNRESDDEQNDNTRQMNGRNRNDKTGQIVDAIDDDEAQAIGGSMDQPKLPGMIRISGCNPDGIKPHELASQLQHSMDLEIDIQCYAEVNRNFLRSDQRHKFFEGMKTMDRSSKGVWGTSLFSTDSEYKPGGTAIISRGKTAGRIKKHGSDKLGRWTYQLLDGQGDRDILIVSVYQCCRQPTNPGGHTAYHQQEVLLSERDSTDRDPRRNFFKDIKDFIQKYISIEESTIVPIIIGDWNE